MGRIDEEAKRPVTRRLRLLVMRCVRCSVSYRVLLFLQYFVEKGSGFTPQL